ncbi:MAG: DUF3772 domain-containing protein [Paracoccus sp. (in: a-proteobacteria)]|nr:DUF3772 domain-containing protein [Paracoccus sp. (in: a-proteobacteria)]
MFRQFCAGFGLALLLAAGGLAPALAQTSQTTDATTAPATTTAQATDAAATGQATGSPATATQSAPAITTAPTTASQVVPTGDVQGPVRPIDYAAWDSFANRVENSLDSTALTEAQLTQLRAEVVSWRTRFNQLQGTNANRIRTVREQIEALGPAPAEGETEAEDVATRRAELNSTLAELQAPGIAAAEAFSRADALVRTIDELTRERQAEELARLTPSPLLPSSWAAAWSDLRRFLSDTGAELRQGVARAQSTDRAELLRAGFPIIAALLLLTIGRRYLDKWPASLSSRTSGSAKAAVVFVVSLLQIAIPVIGVGLLVHAAEVLDIFGPLTMSVFNGIPPAALVLFVGLWLGRNMFSETAIVYDTLNVPQEKRSAAKFATAMLSLLTALHVVVGHRLLPLSGWRAEADMFAAAPPISEAAASVFHLAIMLPAAWFLFRISNTLRRLNRGYGEETPPFRSRALSTAGSVLRFVAVLAPLALAVGWVNLSNAVFWSSVLSLGLIGLLILLQDFLADIYATLRRGDETARDGLTPLLLGIFLMLASVPVFALLWGISTTELGEWRSRLMQGMSVGGIRLSPGAIVTFIVVFLLGALATRWAQSVVKSSILPKTRLDAGAQNAAVAGLGYIGIFLASLFAITSAGFDLSSLAIIAGALSVGIGFGMQNIVSNFVSGIILLIERPISVGDWIESGGRMGIVNDISVRSTRIRTFDQTDVIVPNSDLITSPVINWTRGNLRGRIIVPVSVAYRTDTRLVQKILLEIAEEQPTVLIDPGPSVFLVDFGADGIDFELRCILSDINGGMGVSSEIRHEILRRFREAEIEIPSAQRDLWLRNPEVLHDAGKAKDPVTVLQHDPVKKKKKEAEAKSAPIRDQSADETAPANEPDLGGADADAGVDDSPR